MGISNFSFLNAVSLNKKVPGFGESKGFDNFALRFSVGSEWNFTQFFKWKFLF